MAIVDNYNKRLAGKLFLIMDAKELQTGEDSDEWVKHILLGVVDELNNEKKPNDRFSSCYSN